MPEITRRSSTRRAPGWWFGKCGSIADHAPSDNLNNDPAIPEPPTTRERLNQHLKTDQAADWVWTLRGAATERLGNAFLVEARLPATRAPANKEHHVGEIIQSTLIRRKPNLLDAAIDEEVVALDVEGGECYGFNAIASAVWEKLSEETSVQDICRDLQREYDVTEEVCRDQVLRLVRRLDHDGLIITA